MKSSTISRISQLLCISMLSASMSAQDVYLSEIHPSATEPWVELHNRSANTVDLSTWSLHCATATPFMPQKYWWPFPAGMTLQPGAFLRVHWFVSAPSNPAAGELYTGTSPYGFLFGLGGEALPQDEGAMALFRSQSNAQMNSSSVVVDWVGWGTSGFQREPLAIAAGLWLPGRATASIAPGASLARDESAIGTTAWPDLTWFLDFTPTPGGPNVSGALVESYGTPCTLPGHHLFGDPQLQASAMPQIGDAQFALELHNTTGIFGEFVVFGFSADAAPTALPSILPGYSGTGCTESIDSHNLLLTWLVPSQLLQTDMPLPLAGHPPQIAGLELHVQALVLELLPTTYPPYQGLSNALRLVIGQ